MRVTYAIYLELGIDSQLPGFWEGIAQFEFCAGLDRMNFRIRQEIARLEVEQVTDENRGRGKQVVERIARQMFLPALRRLTNSPELDAATASRIAEVSVSEVEDAPNPKWTHGMEGERSTVLCPKCGSAMKRRPGRDGRQFYGCSGYPQCRGSRPISQ